MKRNIESEKDKIISELNLEIKNRDEYLSKVSHDLKNPLTSILLNLQLMLRKIKNTKPDKLDTNKLIEMLELTNTQANRLTELIDDRLNFSKRK